MVPLAPAGSLHFLDGVLDEDVEEQRPLAALDQPALGGLELRIGHLAAQAGPHRGALRGAHSLIAMHDVAPVEQAHAAIASTPVNSCRRSRRRRASGTAANAAASDDVTATSLVPAPTPRPAPDQRKSPSANATLPTAWAVACPRTEEGPAPHP
jgi:hypothetical protein